MFTTMRRSWLLVALFALVALTSALNLEPLNMDGIQSYMHHGKKRQAPGTGTTSSTPVPSSTPTPSPSDVETSAAPSSTPPPPPETTPSSPPTQASSTPPPSSAPSSTPPPSSDPTSSPKSSSTRLTAPVTKSTPLVSTEYSTFTKTLTDSAGQTYITTGTETSLHTTGSVFSTELPSPQDGAASGDGLSTAKKNIIGGVVGGVGGALLLGGLAVVAWRIWGRKKHVSEDDDDLTFSTGSALGDKTSPPSSANTPFKSNLEQYHNPGGRPNAAANF